MIFEDLDRDVRASLRTLSKENAIDVGRHLMMVGLLIDDDPEQAYLHAQVAVSRGGRVDVVREAAALAAYATARYAEALRELRTVRRLNGQNDHLALEADCERGLGRPERALALAHGPEAAGLAPIPRAELDIVIAGARLDLGDPAAALLVLQRIVAPDAQTSARIAEASIDVLRALGRDAEADLIESTLPVESEDNPEVEVIVYDTLDEGTSDEAEPVATLVDPPVDETDTA